MIIWKQMKKQQLMTTYSVKRRWTWNDT